MDTINTIDVNDAKYYSRIQDEIECDMARMKKCVAVVNNLRLAAAEMEADTAALYHAQLWHDIEELKIKAAKKPTQSGDSGSYSPHKSA